ncbi:hypothetical protein N7509_007214 [Penicillium cosmopolitanum]|uniref:Uncharacterized protein n=1 Tax=Penicillium cosmopolitanum TaxID=1131564 RepID=A0A9W9VYL0_9EURO|nr:uncharacterized protein N7509_007214 [Penicillium cosmopolitanum]KAJ5391724.1 hypothetical protein N7509_007214 [Penicillium cosmopolitanum]
MKNYFTARRFGANVQILLHDLWGIDGYDSVADIPTPGDNGDWTDYNNFLSAIFSIFIENNVIDGVYFDITNEIDNTQYYTRGLDRYLEIWGLTYHRVAYVQFLQTLSTSHNIYGSTCSDSEFFL